MVAEPWPASDGPLRQQDVHCRTDPATSQVADGEDLKPGRH
jgi:hypothetical protein